MSTSGREPYEIVASLFTGDITLEATEAALGAVRAQADCARRANALVTMRTSP